LSEESFVDILEEGLYRYEVYIISNQAGTEIECSSAKEFTVISSEIATINFIRKEQIGLLFNIEVQVSGNGDY